MNCDTDTCTLFMKHLIPGLGGIVAAAIGFAPMKSVLQVKRERDLASVNPLPFAFLLANSIAWLLYAFMLRDPYIVAPNFISLHLSLYYCLETLPFTPDKTRKLMMIALSATFFLIFMGATIAFVVFNGNFVAKNILGNVCLLVLIVFYSSPLSDIMNVIRSKNAMSIDPFLSIASLCTATLWAVYGVVQGDVYLYSPQLLGIICGVLQFILIGVYGRRPTGKLHDKEHALKAPLVLSVPVAHEP